LGKMGDVARAGRTVVLVTHQMNQIRRLSHRVMWIEDGKIRLMGPTNETVTAYEKAMSSNDASAPRASQSRRYQARFVNWCLDSEEEGSNHILDTLGPVRVRFGLEVNEPLSHVHHGISLFNLDKQLIWGFSTDDLAFEPGFTELSYEFPFLPLRPGTYFWQVTLWNGGTNIDIWDGSPEMIVATENYQHARDEWNGFLNVPGKLSQSHISSGNS